MRKTNKKFKIGLVLSGGGARGFAHLGVLKALNEKGIYPDVISGTSAGAIAGAFYCDGYHPEEILSFFIEKGLYKYIEFIIPKKGLIKITGLLKLIEGHLRAECFEELKLPLFTTATDFNNAKPVYFSSGKLLPAVIASSAIPVIFQPFNLNAITYVDGGLTDNLPIEPIKDNCEKIIGVNVNPIGFQRDFNKLMNIAERTFHIAFNAGLYEKIPQFNLYIQPDALKNYGIFDVSKSPEIFNIGYYATLKALETTNYF